MKKSIKPFRTLALSFLLASTSLTAAYAQAAQEAVDRLKTLMEQQQAVIEWDRVDISGDDAVLVGVKVGAGETRQAIGDINLTGITKSDDGYRIEEVTFDELTMGDDSGSVHIEGAELTGVLLPDDSKLDNYGGTFFYETSNVGSVVVSVGDDAIASLTDFYTEMSAPLNGEPMTYSGSADEFYLDLSIVEDPNQAAIIKALGYEEVTGSMEFEGYWQPTDGRFALNTLDLAVDEAGTLGLVLDIGGYTPAFIGSLRDLQAQMAANPEGDNSTQGLAILGLMQQLTFHSAEVSFSDASLTNKVLEFVANSQGMKASDIANQAKAVVPFALGQLGNPALTMQATQAISTYLDNPQTLRIKAAPPAPVPFALIAAGAMAAPTELTKTLGVAVTAND